MKRTPQILSGILCTGLLLSGCGDAPAKESGPESSDYGYSIELADDYDPDAHFDWAYVGFPASWDPTKSATGGDINFYEPVYDRLLFETAEGDVEPMLATEFTPADDGKSLTLTLREGLAFSDGTPFDAAAVKFNLDRSRATGSTIAGELHQLTSVEVVDDHTVTLQLSGSIGSLPVALANRAGIMVSPTAVQSGQLSTQPVGVGPYVTTEIVPGDKMELAKSEDYWDPDAQRVATMTYYYMPDDQTRLNALQSGQVDAARINPDQIDVVADMGITPLVKPSNLFLYLVVNPGKAPFDNPEVLKALNMALDREAISQGLYDGYCTPQIQPFLDTSVGYSEKIGDGSDVFGYDPEAAKKILQDAGVTEVTATTVTPNVTIYTKFAEVVQEQLADIGINLKIQAIPPAEMVQEFVLDKNAETLSSVSTGINDPDLVLSRYLAPDALYNVNDTDYPELVAAGTEGASSLDPEVRKAAYEKFMQEWVEHPPHVIPVCMTHLASAYSENVSGVKHKENGFPDLRNVAVSED